MMCVCNFSSMMVYVCVTVSTDVSLENVRGNVVYLKGDKICRFDPCVYKRHLLGRDFI
jgi:hypothetical protein